MGVESVCLFFGVVVYCVCCFNGVCVRLFRSVFFFEGCGGGLGCRREWRNGGVIRSGFSYLSVHFVMSGVKTHHPTLKPSPYSVYCKSTNTKSYPQQRDINATIIKTQWQQMPPLRGAAASHLTPDGTHPIENINDSHDIPAPHEDCTSLSQELITTAQCQCLLTNSAETGSDFPACQEERQGQG